MELLLKNIAEMLEVEILATSKYKFEIVESNIAVNNLEAKHCKMCLSPIIRISNCIIILVKRDAFFIGLPI